MMMTTILMVGATLLTESLATGLINNVKRDLIKPKRFKPTVSFGLFLGTF